MGSKEFLDNVEARMLTDALDNIVKYKFYATQYFIVIALHKKPKSAELRKELRKANNYIKRALRGLNKVVTSVALFPVEREWVLKKLNKLIISPAMDGWFTLWRLEHDVYDEQKVYDYISDAQYTSYFALRDLKSLYNLIMLKMLKDVTSRLTGGVKK